MERGLISDRELVRPHGEAAPLLEAGDTPLDGIALVVCLSVEAGRAASGATSPKTVTDLVGGLRDDGPNAASTQVPADRARRVGAIRQDGCWTGSWPSASASRNPDSGHHRHEGRHVARLARGDVNGQRSGLGVTGQMDLRAQTAARASECVICRLGPTRLPFFGLRPNAGEPGRRWSQPRLSSPRRRRRPPRSGPRQGSVPMCRPRPT